MTLEDVGITGQLHFDSHVVRTVQVAAALVNALAITQAHGRPVHPPARPKEVRTGAQEALRDAGVPQPDIHTDDAAGLQRLAGQLRAVFAALAGGHEDDAAALLNDLLRQSAARPYLHRHPPAPWHLHFHPPDTGLADGWAAGCATGLATVLGSQHATRLGTCAAPACDRVYLDTSRNNSRRYCSTTCQNRVKAAVHRARAKQ